MLRLHQEVWSPANKDNYIKDTNFRIKNDPSLKIIVKNIFIANCALLAMGCAFLAYVLSEFPPSAQITRLNSLIMVFLVWLSIKFCFLPPLTGLLADSLVAIILTFNLGFLLLFLRFRNLWWLLFACIVAVYASLVKPSFYFLPLLCGLICLWIVVENLYKKSYMKAFKAFIIGLLLSIGVLVWPVLLYIQGGFFIPSQISHITNYVVASFLTMPGDENLNVDENSKIIIKKILEYRPEIVETAKKLHVKYPYSNLSEMHRFYVTTFDPVARQRFKIGNEMKLPKGYLAYAKQINDFAPEVIKAHRAEYFRLLLSNFLRALNQFPQIRVTYTWWLSDHYRLAFLVIALALIFGLPSFRQPIGLFTAVHILHAAFCSYGAYILTRYMEATEFIFLLSFLLSMYSIFMRLILFIMSHKIVRLGGGIKR